MLRGDKIWGSCSSLLVPFLPIEQPCGACRERAHLAYGNGIELRESIALRQPHVNELGVEAFHVGQHEQLFDGGVVAQVAIEFGFGIAPLPGGLPEHGDVEQIGLVGIGHGRLCGCDFRRDQVGLDGIGVDAVVDLGESAIEVPCKGKSLPLIVLEALEFLDEVDLERRADPHAEPAYRRQARRRCPCGRRCRRSVQRWPAGRWRWSSPSSPSR